MLDVDRLHSQIGERMRRVRERGTPPTSQARLAEILKLQRTSVTNIEAGRQKPSLETIYRFCEHFGLQVGEFLPTVGDVQTIETESVTVGPYRVDVGTKTAQLIHELRAQHQIDSTHPARRPQRTNEKA